MAHDIINDYHLLLNNQLSYTKLLFIKVPSYEQSFYCSGLVSVSMPSWGNHMTCHQFKTMAHMSHGSKRSEVCTESFLVGYWAFYRSFDQSSDGLPLRRR